MEVLVKAGAFDGIGSMHRAQYFYKENQLETTPTYLDMLVKWAIRRQDGAASNQMSIFSMSEELAEEDHPPIPVCPEWSTIERCRAEKEVISTYLSGHPLDDFKHEMSMFTNIGVDQLSALEQLAGREVRFAGLVSGVKDGVSAKGNPYGSMVIDDYSGSYELRLYDDEYTSFKNFFTNDTFVYARAQVRTFTYKDKKTGADRTVTRMRILSMMLLSKVMDKYTSKLSFLVPLECVDEDFCKSLKKLAHEYKGDVPLQAQVIDARQGLTLTLNTPDLRVSAHDIIPELEALKGISQVQPILKS
jgi:DNA polymerase-3 subunit alpha